MTRSERARINRLFWCAPEDVPRMSKRAMKIIDANRWRMANALAWFEARKSLAPSAIFYEDSQNRAWFWHVVEGGLRAGRKIPIGAVLRGPQPLRQFRKMEKRLHVDGYTLHCEPNPKGYTDYWVQPARLARVLGGEE
jgi:hypothetical protein